MLDGDLYILNRVGETRGCSALSPQLDETLSFPRQAEADDPAGAVVEHDVAHHALQTRVLGSGLTLCKVKTTRPRGPCPEARPVGGLRISGRRIQFTARHGRFPPGFLSLVASHVG